MKRKTAFNISAGILALGLLSSATIVSQAPSNGRKSKAPSTPLAAPDAPRSTTSPSQTEANNNPDPDLIDDFFNRPENVLDGLTEEQIQIIADEIVEAAKGKTYINLLDTDHRDVRMKELLAHEKIVEAFAKSGITSIGLEIAPTSQRLFDLYQNDQIDRQTFLAAAEFNFNPHAIISQDPDHLKRFYHANADLVENAKAKGIEIRLVNVETYKRPMPEYVTGTLDDMTDLWVGFVQSTPEYFTFSQEERKKAHTHLGNQAQQQVMLQRIMSLSEAERAKMIANAEQVSRDMAYNEQLNPNALANDPEKLMAYLALRLEADKDIASYASENGRRTAILFGAAHFTRFDDDIDFHLGDVDTLMIGVYPNRASIAASQQRLEYINGEMLNAGPVEYPGFNILLDEGIFEANLQAPNGPGKIISEDTPAP